MRSCAPLFFFALVGCGSILGLRDIEESAEPALEQNDGGDSTPVQRDGAVQNKPDATAGDASLTSADAGDSGPPGIDCLGRRIDAFYCDGFDDAAINTAAWKVATAGGADNVFGVEPDPTFGGTHRAQAHTGNGTGPLKATATWTRPTPGPLAFQFNMLSHDDAWTSGQFMPVAALTTTAGKRVEVRFTASGTNANGTMTVTFEGTTTTLTLGTIDTNQWHCIEIVADGPTLTAYYGQTKAAGAIENVGDIASAELGVPPVYLANKDVFYDEVVLAPARVGCLH